MDLEIVTLLRLVDKLTVKFDGSANQWYIRFEGSNGTEADAIEQKRTMVELIHHTFNSITVREQEIKRLKTEMDNSDREYDSLQQEMSDWRQKAIRSSTDNWE